MIFGSNRDNLKNQITRGTKITAVLLVSIPLLILVVAMIYLTSFFVEEHVAFANKTPITVEGEVSRILSRYAVFKDAIIIEQGTYYVVVDAQDEPSRQKNITKDCTTGAVGCYQGRRVRVYGFLITRRKLFGFLPANFPREFNLGQGQPQELEVRSFEVLE